MRLNERHVLMFKITLFIKFLILQLKSGSLLSKKYCIFYEYDPVNDMFGISFCLLDQPVSSFYVKEKKKKIV